MVDDTNYITPHEAALAVVATAMKKSRLPFHILVINSIIGGFLFSAGGMLYVMCESTSIAMRRSDGGDMNMFVTLAGGAVYAIGLFYVIVCGMELFNSNILFFSTGVMRGAVTLMDLLISWWVSFWVNLASTIFVIYLFCHLSKVFQQPDYVIGTISIAKSKDSFSFMETFLKGVAGNFFVCLAVYLQIMVKPLHVKLTMIFLPIFTFVAMGFTHAVADMFLVPAGIFNDCGYGFGHYFWKIMLPGSLGNIVGGSFFGIVIPWYLHLVVVEQDMKKLNLPAYEEKDEQPGLNMDSRVVRVPIDRDDESSNLESTSIEEFKPDDERDISRIATRNTVTSGATVGSGSLRRVRSSVASAVRSPKGVFPVADMGPPLEREMTIAKGNSHPSLTVDQLIDNNSADNNVDDNDQISQYTVGPLDNPYSPQNDKMGNRLMRAITRSVTRTGVADTETGETEGDLEKGTRAQSYKNQNSFGNRLAHATTVMEGEIEHKKEKFEKMENSPYNKSLLRQFTFGGGGNNPNEIHRRLSNAGISRKAAALSNDIAGIHTSTVDWNVHTKKSRHADRRRSSASSAPTLSKEDKNKLGVKYANDRWKHMVYDYELDSELPVSFISQQSSRHGPLDDVEEDNESESDSESLSANEDIDSDSSTDSGKNASEVPVNYNPKEKVSD